MALCGITDARELQWFCPGSEEAEEECDRMHTIPFDQAEYLLAPESEGPRGATIRLPRCPCGVQTFLKSDYTIRELFKTTISFTDDHGQIWAYGLPWRHMYNMITHQLLYDAGLARHAPILPMPKLEALQDPRVQAIGGSAALLSIWFGFAAVASKQKEELPAPKDVLLLLEMQQQKIGMRKEDGIIDDQRAGSHLLALP